MLKGLILGLKNKFRRVAEANTDIAGAGREHVHNVAKSIADLTNQRDEIAADGALLESQIKAAENKLNEYREAVQHWHGKDEAKMQSAYAKFQAQEKKLKDLKARLSNIQTRVAKIDGDLARLNNAKEGLKDDLADAAIIQASARVNTQIEDVHADIDTGPLAGAIDYARRQEAVADVKRVRREGEDESDLFSFKQDQGTSLADILGQNAEPQLATATTRDLGREHTSTTVVLDESPVQSGPRGAGANHVYVDERTFNPESSKVPDSLQDRHVETRTHDSSPSNDTSTTSESSSSSD